MKKPEPPENILLGVAQGWLGRFAERALPWLMAFAWLFFFGSLLWAKFH